MLSIPAGPFLRGSSESERVTAYDDYRHTAGRDTARQRSWFQYEPEVQEATLGAYKFDSTPVTQAAFAEYLGATGGERPYLSESTWLAQGFVQNYQREVQRFNWSDDEPPRGRENHPVVLVSWFQARSYCRWRGRLVGQERFLPSADQFERAARGPGQAAYPWGQDYDPQRLNSAVNGRRDTMPVKSHPDGRSPLGAYDAAGNVFQWTSTPWRGSGRMTVKGSAWDDHGGLGRAAAAHGRRKSILHAIIGFRCAG